MHEKAARITLKRRRYRMLTLFNGRAEFETIPKYGRFSESRFESQQTQRLLALALCSSPRVRPSLQIVARRICTRAPPVLLHTSCATKTPVQQRTLNPLSTSRFFYSPRVTFDDNDTPSPHNTLRCLLPQPVRLVRVFPLHPPSAVPCVNYPGVSVLTSLMVPSSLPVAYNFPSGLKLTLHMLP